jgi:hypothetical protein
MTGEQLTNRLLEDLAHASLSKSLARDLKTLQINMYNFSILGTRDDFPLEEMWIATTFEISLPATLKRLLQFINLHGAIFSLGKNQYLLIPEYTHNVALNKEAISKKFQKIIDNQNLAFISSSSDKMQPLSELLIDELNYIHLECTRLLRSYEILKTKRSQHPLA